MALQKRCTGLPHQVAWSGSNATISDITDTSVTELAKVSNPHKLLGKTYQVDVAFRAVCPEQSWWYLGCIICKKRVFIEGDTYRCPKCSGNKAEPMYRISIIATDPQNFMEHDAPTIQIVFFGNIGEELTGVPAIHLAAIYEGNNVSVPSEIARLYNHKFTLRISVPFSSIQRDNISFQVKSIVSTGGPLIISPTDSTPSGPQEEHQGASTQNTISKLPHPSPDITTTSAEKEVDAAQEKDKTETLLSPSQHSQQPTMTPTSTSVSMKDDALSSSSKIIPSTSADPNESSTDPKELSTDPKEKRNIRRRLNY
ncbi:unnamed protein product [Urochloa humidicola]